jgi:hypothetical protein
MSFRHSFMFALIGLAALLVASCGGSRILLDPPASRTKTVALVSVSSPSELLSSSGGGGALSVVQNTSSGLTAEASRTVALSLQKYAADTFSEELGTVPGLQAVSLSAAMGNPGYAKAAEGVNRLGKERNSKLLRFFSANDGVMLTANVGTYSGWKETLAKAAQTMNVDAVAVLELGLTFRPNSITGISDEAIAEVAASLTAVSHDGAYLANTKGPDFTKYRCESKTLMPMKGANLASADAAEKSFKEALHDCIGKIGNDMRLDRAKK